MKTDRSGRTLEDYRELFWETEKRIKELEAAINRVGIITHQLDQDEIGLVAAIKSIYEEVDAALLEKQDV